MSGVDEVVMDTNTYVGEDSVIYQLLDDTKKLVGYLREELGRGEMVSLSFIRAIMPFGIDMLDVRHINLPKYYYKTLSLMVQEMLVDNLVIDLRTPWGRYISQDVIQNVPA